MTNSRDDMELDAAPISLLLGLPTEMLLAIPLQESETEATRMMATLSKTCWQLHRFFQPELAKREAKQLLTYALQGKAAEAKAMYTANPGLLFVETAAEDYAAGIDETGKAVHRIIEASPFKAMLGAGDIWMLKRIPTHYFDLVIDEENHKTFRQLAAEQFVQQFPNGCYEYPPSTYDFSELVSAIAENLTGRPSVATEVPLAKFRKAFMPGTVKNGYHFNLNELVKVWEIYNKNYGLWNCNQQSLFFRQVIGYLERLVPSIDAQVLCQGIENIVEKGEALKRSVKLKNYVIGEITDEMISYFPLDTDPNRRLGLEFAVDSSSCVVAAWAGATGDDEDWGQRVVLCKSYVEQKQQALGILCSNYSNGQTNSRQVVSNVAV